MDKKTFLRTVKKTFTELGFQFKGNNGYKIVDADYLIGICLEHHSYCKAYYIDYGVVYLPDEHKFPFTGWFDWDDHFLFTKIPNDGLSEYDIENLDRYDNDGLVGYFEYELRDTNELLEQIQKNIEKRMILISDKAFVLKYYSNHLDRLARLPVCTVEKLLKLYAFDSDEINRLRHQWQLPRID